MTSRQIIDLLNPDQLSLASVVLTTLRYVQEANAGSFATSVPNAIQRGGRDRRSGRRQGAPTLELRRFSPDQAATLHDMIVSKIWEPDLRRELVDRIVYAFDHNWIDAATLKAAISKAKAAKNDYERSQGAVGRDSVWKSLGCWIKGVFSANGERWTPTGSAVEPRPVPKKAATVSEPTLFDFVDGVA